MLAPREKTMNSRRRATCVVRERVRVCENSVHYVLVRRPPSMEQNKQLHTEQSCSSTPTPTPAVTHCALIAPARRSCSSVNYTRIVFTQTRPQRCTAALTRCLIRLSRDCQEAKRNTFSLALYYVHPNVGLLSRQIVTIISAFAVS